MMKNTSQYACPSKQNKNTYSDEFMKIILLSCSEIDSILKVICKENNVMLKDKDYNMYEYAKSNVIFEFSNLLDVNPAPFIAIIN